MKKEKKITGADGPPSFSRTLFKHGLRLDRGKTTTLQVNLGLQCNQACKHCHLDAGPGRKELMTAETIEQVVDYAERGGFETIDITGGAPELNPHLATLVSRAEPLVDTLMMRCNLSVITDGYHDHLIEILKKNSVVIVASFPAINAAQTDAQRGSGVYEKSVASLKKLNDIGYGRSGTGLIVNLVSNPTGALIPTGQAQAENRFREILGKKFGITFNQLLLFGNVPLGRFRRWLIQTDNYDAYIKKLVSSFNPCATTGLMCRSLVSVSWDGFLYDCDFNLAAGMPLGGQKTHVNEMVGAPAPGQTIAVGEHCYTCTAGAGFT